MPRQRHVSHTSCWWETLNMQIKMFKTEWGGTTITTRAAQQWKIERIAILFVNRTCDTAIKRAGITSSSWLMFLQEVVHGDEPMGSFHCFVPAICHSVSCRNIATGRVSTFGIRCFGYQADLTQVSRTDWLAFLRAIVRGPDRNKRKRLELARLFTVRFQTLASDCYRYSRLA